MARGETSERFKIGKVLAESLALIGGNAPALLLLAVTIGWLPHLALAQAHLPTLARGRWDAVAWVVRVATTLLNMFLSELLLICVVRLVLTKDSGFAARIGGTVRAVAPRIPQLIALTLILDAPALLQVLAALRYSPLVGASSTSLGASGYMLIWAVIGLIANIWIMSWVGVAGPVFIEESLPVGLSLRHAAKLLDRSRWKFMGLWIPFFLTGLALLTALNVPLRLSQASGHGSAARPLALISLETAIFGAISSVVLAVCYRELRRLKDNPADEIANVFD